MVNLTINSQQVTIAKGTSICDAAASIGIKIPKLCYLKDINEIGACRVCVVEIEGKDTLVASCNTMVEEGMVVLTHSPKAMAARRTNVELMLSQHDCRCAVCIRSGNCALQQLSNDLMIFEVPFPAQYEKQEWNQEFPLIRDSQKCIKCMRCVQICDKIQGLNVWDIINTGKRTSVNVSGNRKIEESDCALCGQCLTHCPVGALRERNDIDKIIDAITDEDKIIVVQIAPAVRAAWGESFDLPREKATVKRLVAALRRTGIDYIFDTNFAADLTIMEEGSEFLSRLKNNASESLPLFTSCCPGWVRFIKARYPEYVKNLSTAKSPQQMFGAVTKSYYAQLLDVDPSRIFSVSIMPCTAKKHECGLPVMKDAGSGPDVDIVLTTREVGRLLRAEHIIPELLPEEEFDLPLGIGTGAGVIFGATGGVMEAALRSAHYLVTGENPDPEAFQSVRGLDGIKEAVFSLGGKKIKTAVVNGLKNAEILMEAMKAKEVDYDFVEVMACPGGCAGGGGQPICDGEELAEVRGKQLYELDKDSELRFSHENPSITKIYKDFLEAPLSPKSHMLLHTDHSAWDMPAPRQKKK